MYLDNDQAEGPISVVAHLITSMIFHLFASGKHNGGRQLDFILLYP